MNFHQRWEDLGRSASLCFGFRESAAGGAASGAAVLGGRSRWPLHRGGWIDFPVNQAVTRDSSLEFLWSLFDV